MIAMERDNLRLRQSTIEEERDEARQRLEAAVTLPDMNEALMAVGSPASDTPDRAVTEVARGAISDLVETAMVGRAAEALRRHRSERLLIGVAASDRAFRTITIRNQGTCTCYQTALIDLATKPPLPTTEGHPILQGVVNRVLRSAKVKQPVDLDRQKIGDYTFDDVADSTLVHEAIRTSQDNPVDYDILEGCLCVDPHASARSRVRLDWPFPIPEDSPTRPSVEEAVRLAPAPSPVPVGETEVEIHSTPAE